MAARDKLAAKAAPFLEDGEAVRQAFRARVMLPGTRLAKATFVVIGTQQAVLILRTSNWSTTTPKHLVARVPKGSPMSLHKSGIWSRLQIGEHQLRITGRSTNAEAEQLVGA